MKFNPNEEKSKNLVKIIQEILAEKDKLLEEKCERIKRLEDELKEKETQTFDTEKDEEINRLKQELSNFETDVEFWQAEAEDTEGQYIDLQCKVIEIFVPHLQPPCTVRIINADECEIIRTENGEIYIDTVENIAETILKDVERSWKK